MHDQYHGPVPVTGEAVSALQRLVVGALLDATPFDEPQDSTGGGKKANEITGPAAGSGTECGRLAAGTTETAISMVEFPGTLLILPDTVSEKKSRP
jgi:hypothetical protein